MADRKMTRKQFEASLAKHNYYIIPEREQGFIPGYDCPWTNSYGTKKVARIGQKDYKGRWLGGPRG